MSVMNERKIEKPKNRFRRTGLLFGMGGVLVIALTAGGMTWHRQPGSCGICHTPMASYVQGYNSGDGAIMVTSHAQGEEAVRCLDCHRQTLKEESTELVHWITGDYEFPLKKRELGTRAFCLASGCHDEGEILEATREEKMARPVNASGDAGEYNQHDPRHGKQDCNRCHSVHGRSVMLCNQCHKLQAPEGWISPAPNGVAAAL